MATPHVSDCIFCQIASGQLPAATVVETDDILVILDAFPSSQGHSLILPKAHHTDLMQMPPDLLAQCAKASRQVAQALMQALEPDGIAVTQFNGAAAGQTVFHYHQHVIPRWQGQDWRSHGRVKADIEDLHALAERIRASLDW